MPDNNNDLEPRVAVLETETETLKRANSHQWAKLDQIQDDLVEVKEHLAHQNGAFPHMQARLDEVAVAVGKLVVVHQDEEVEQAKITTKTKIYLGIAALIGAAILGGVIKVWLPIIVSVLFGVAILL